MNKIFLFTIGFLITIGLHAQDSTYQSQSSRSNQKKQRINHMLRMEEDGDLIFNKENIFGIKLASDGYGLSFEKGKFITNRKTRIIQFELNEKKSNKEYTFKNGDIFGTSEVLYKLNNFYQFKASYGYQYLIGSKGNKNGVNVTWLYSGGASLGFQKPYYLNVDNSLNTLAPSSQLTWPQFFADTANGNSPLIQSAAGFLTGWSKVELKPGLAAKVALRFDFGRFNRSITAIEAGLNFEYYFSPIEQVMYVAPKTFFFNSFVTIMFGSRK